ncbi:MULTISPECIES: hypothetical protein [Sphingobium]|uniref:hypothetical protein n=1 Tax=Sphingobium TaxID=165695 RepID=UPI00159CA649|nr:hypothetical protein [Sphingobium sp. 15-1]
MGQFFQFMLLHTLPKISIERLRSPGKRAERINWDPWGTGRQTLAGFGGPWRNRVEIGVRPTAPCGRRRFFPTASQGHSAQRFPRSRFERPGKWFRSIRSWQFLQIVKVCPPVISLRQTIPPRKDEALKCRFGHFRACLGAYSDEAGHHSDLMSAI